MAGKQDRRAFVSLGRGSATSLVVILFLVGGCGPQTEPTSTPVPSVVVTASPSPPSEEAFRQLEARMKMVETQIRRRGVTDQDVLEAMEKVLRHEFVPEHLKAQAYADHPLPIGYGQTISQPYIVALMTELLELESTDRVLEIGTGSGYQAAILAEIVAQVYTVEIVEPLAIEARERLARLGYTNVYALHADGYFGWEEHAPYDAIIVTAAPDHIPLPLVQQLEDGAHMVIPIGPPGGYQTLWQISKEGDQIKKRNITGVLFVPLTGDH
jgi:protein-L-isoaspartate(D-aspartate) O-methyltransferase